MLAVDFEETACYQAEQDQKQAREAERTRRGGQHAGRGGVSDNVGGNFEVESVIGDDDEEDWNGSE